MERNRGWPFARRMGVERESEDEILVPVTTDLLPAPDDLMRII